MVLGADKIKRCRSCEAELQSGAKYCLRCGAPVDAGETATTLVRPVLTWRLLRHVVIAALLFATPWYPQAIKFVRRQLPLWTSPLVSMAVRCANDHRQAIAILGKPITAGWNVKGYIRDDETGWSESQLWIPVSGSEGQGTLYTRAGRGSGPWVFSDFKLVMVDGRSVDLLERTSLSARSPIGVHDGMCGIGLDPFNKANS
jgi:Cytochrome oxidase complex assembly protein 1